MSSNVIEIAQVQINVSYLRAEVNGPALRRTAGERRFRAGRIQYKESSLVASEFGIPLPSEEWKPPTQPKYPMPEFKPSYSANNVNHNNSPIFNAIYEIKELWEYVIKEALHNYSNIYSQLRIPIRSSIKQDCQKHKEAFAVYDRVMKAWLVEPSEPKYEYCYNGEDFENFEVAKNKSTSNRLLLVGKYTKLMQEPNLVRETKLASSMMDVFRRPSMRLIVGVPGCGKTTYIIRNHAHGSLVLTSGAEGAADIRSRIAQINNNYMPPKLRDSYRTIDSYLLHNRRQYREVWVDEALMEHPGKLFLVCLYSRCRVLHMLGDPNQLEYINRVNSIDLRYDKSSLFFSATDTLNTSYRCPVDVMAIISSKYDGGAYSASTIMRSMQCVKYTSLENVPKNDDDTKYLVFKQAEKKEMKKAGYNVSTIHEYQGKQEKNVVIVRMSHNLRESLYESAAHILVGMTRHTKSLVYYTPVIDDLHRLMNTPLTDEQLRKHQKLTESPYRPRLRNEISLTARNRISTFATEEKTFIEHTIAALVLVSRWTLRIVASACRWTWNLL